MVSGLSNPWPYNHGNEKGAPPMEHETKDQVVMSTEMREGTLLYTDPHRVPPVRAIGILTAVAFHDPQSNGVKMGWHQSGYVISAMEALAGYFAANPAMKAVFDGMYLGHLTAKVTPPTL
jgi:hypothetical protein